MREGLQSILKEDQIQFQDFLQFDLTQLDQDQFNVIGNFPYNISSQIIFKILEIPDRVPSVIGMFQKEMAQRICAVPGSKANGVITIKTQLLYDAEILFNISPECFNPPPKIESSIIRLTRNDRTYDHETTKALYKVVNAAFGQRRKKMRNTLKPFLTNTEADLFQKRPEQLAVEDFLNIVDLIRKEKTGI